MSTNLRTAKSNGAKASSGEGPAIEARVNAADLAKVHADLDAQGWSVVPKLMTDREADLIAGLHHQEQGFRSHVIMAGSTAAPAARCRNRRRKVTGRTSSGC